MEAIVLLRSLIQILRCDRCNCLHISNGCHCLTGGAALWNLTLSFVKTNHTDITAVAIICSTSVVMSINYFIPLNASISQCTAGKTQWELRHDLCHKHVCQLLSLRKFGYNRNDVVRNNIQFASIYFSQLLVELILVYCRLKPIGKVKARCNCFRMKQSILNYQRHANKTTFCLL